MLVENRGKGASEESFNHPQLRPFMELAKPARVVLPSLWPDIAQELDRLGQSPLAAIKEPASELLKTGSVRIGLNAWREDLDAQFIRTDASLPL